MLWQKRSILALFLVGIWFFPVSSLAASRTIVATILPLHSLVAGLTAGIHETELLLPVNASPHGYSMRPSEARRLHQGDLVIWVGPELETFLQRPLGEARPGRKVISVMDELELLLLPVRAGGVWEAHAHDDDGHGHGSGSGNGHQGHDQGHGATASTGHDRHSTSDHHHGHAHAAPSAPTPNQPEVPASAPYQFDSHLWLAPENARRIVNGLAEQLSLWDPTHAEQYAQNRDQLVRRIDALEAKLAAQLEPVQSTPFIVFHDAYQYFEYAFGLTAAGSITLDPARSPGARRIQELRTRLQRDDVACLFTEPQFRPALALTLIEGSNARFGELDPLGSNLQPGPDAWFELQQNLADALYSCLSGSNRQ